jgi:Fe2+ or Zn2+ uptake regulation protein
MILQMEDKIKQYLREAGQSITEPRMAVFRFLQEHDPTTIQAVIAALTPDIDRASVYRTIGLFRELHIIDDIVAGGRRMIELTDSFDSHHHHLTCLRCGRHVTIDDHLIELRLLAIAQAQGFEPTSHQVQISGLCRACRLG